MAKRGDHRVLAAAILGSVAMHALVVVALKRVPRPVERARGARADSVEFEMLAPLPTETLPVLPPPREEAPAAHAPRVLPSAPAPVAQTVPSAAPTGSTPTEPTPVAPPPPAVAVASETPAPALPSTPNALALDPRAVALASLPIDRTRAITGTTGTEGPNRISAAERSAILTQQLAADAHARNYLSNRPPPDLRRQSDGSFVFQGPRFVALVQPDGTVEFSDRGNGGVDRFGSNSGVGLTGHFDLNDAMHRRHGSDPYAEERHWFMRETEDLRTRLADEYRATRARESVRALRGRLQRIWDDAARTPEQRRIAIFRVWDDCADDETGETVRAAVVAFIRDRLPNGTDDAYTGAEIARLNSGRDSAGEFRPY